MLGHTALPRNTFATVKTSAIFSFLKNSTWNGAANLFFLGRLSAAATCTCKF
jgi:hypothetical protein